jgi:hypothetical protein
MSKISSDAFQSKEIVLKHQMSIPKIVKKGILKAHSVGDSPGREVLAMDENSQQTRGAVADTSQKSSVGRCSVW